MLQTIVQRDPANKRGDDITEILLTTLEAQISRGRADINSNCSNRRIVDCNIVPVGFVTPTSTVQVTDIEIGVVHGVVDKFSLQFSIDGDSVTIDSAITYEGEVK